MTIETVIHDSTAPYTLTPTMLMMTTTANRISATTIWGIPVMDSTEAPPIMICVPPSQAMSST